MEIVATPQALRRQLAEQPTGPGGLAFVPTMGNLHDGHLSLVRKALDSADTVAVSIFVNPMQFADGEDLDAYPRTLDRDIELLTEAGADLLFTPNVDALYPQGLRTHTAVRVPGLTEVLCGRHRPGHFDGVTTVVCKLLNLVQPDIALFGEKDLQQLLVIEKMVADLAMPVRVEGVATARAADGLALSSRNGYLSPDERDLAPHLYASLLQIRDASQPVRVNFRVCALTLSRASRPRALRSITANCGAVMTCHWPSREIRISPFLPLPASVARG